MFGFDEARLFTTNPLGRRILEQMQRLGRSQRVVPVLGTQNATDIGVDRDSVSNLFGSIWAFRAPDRTQAEASLALMNLESAPGTIDRLTALPSGAALMLDHRNQAEIVQVKHVPSVFARVRTDRPDAPVA
jgi:hypothetical protein